MAAPVFLEFALEVTVQLQWTAIRRPTFETWTTCVPRGLVNGGLRHVLETGCPQVASQVSHLAAVCLRHTD